MQLFFRTLRALHAAGDSLLKASTHSHERMPLRRSLTTNTIGGSMATKAVTQPPDAADRTSQVQLNLAYAQRVANAVAERQIADRKRRINTLQNLPLEHEADVTLRDEMVRRLWAEIKQLRDGQS